jgi:transketolase
MTVTAVCDANEMTRLMNASLDWPHPIYIRLGKGGEPIVSRDDRGFVLGRPIDMTGADQVGAEVLLLSTGVITSAALTAAEALSDAGIRCRLMHLHTLKPIDASCLVEAAESARLVVTIEEHTLVGGLGSAVLEVLSDNMDRMPKVRRMGITDYFSAHYGSQAEHLARCGLNAAGIQEVVTRELAIL